MDNHLVDVFSGDAFSALTLSTAINMVPNQYGRVNSLGIFADESVDTTMVGIEIENGVLNLIPSSKRGTPAPKSKNGKREVKPFVIPHLTLDDMIFPSDIQNVRAFGTAALKTPESEVNKRLMTLSKKHDITHEFLKCGALAGIIKDADGSTLFNLYTEFDVTEKEVDFALTTDGTKVKGKIDEVVGHIEDNLNGDTMQYVHALCSPEFFTALTTHPKVEQAYLNYMALSDVARGPAVPTANVLRDDVRKGFFFGGVYWEEYRGQATFLNADGTKTVRKFIEANQARFFPVGTAETFRNYAAPADWMETVNTPGLNKYAKVVPEAGGRHVEVLSESNPLPLCLRPGVLVKGKKSA